MEEGTGTYREVSFLYLSLTGRMWTPVMESFYVSIDFSGGYNNLHLW